MKSLSFYLLLLSLLLNIKSYKLYADNATENTDEKEKISLEIFSEINNLSENYGRFIVVRDHNLYGINGISTKFLNCQTDLKKWIDSWSVFIKNINFNTNSDIYPFSTTLQDFFSIQSMQVENIKSNCKNVIKNAKRSLEIINSSRVYSNEVLSKFPYYLYVIDTSKNNLFSVLNKYIIDTENYLKKLKELNIKSHKSVFSKIKIEINTLNPEESIKILKDFYLLIQASRDLNPSITKLELTEKGMNDAAAKFKYFSALKLSENILKDCTKTHKKILNSTVNSSYLHFNFKKLQQSCSNTYDTFMRFKKKFKNKHDYLLNFIEYTKNNVKINCNNNIYIIPCNELSIIKSIKIEELLKFPDNKLSFIEFKLNRILEEYKL